MDAKVRKLITCHKMHHPRADIEHLYGKRENGGKGLIQLKLTYKIATVGLKKYVDTATDSIWQLIYTHENQKKKKSICKESNIFANQHDLTPKEIDIKDKAIYEAKNKGRTKKRED